MLLMFFFLLLVPQRKKKKKKLKILLLEYHVINPDLFFIRPTRLQIGWYSQERYFLFIYPGLYKFIDSCNPGDISSEKRLNDLMR